MDLRRIAELEKGGLRHGAFQGKGFVAAGALPGLRTVVVGLETEIRMRAPVVGLQFRKPEGPAAVWNFRAGFEVDGIERAEADALASVAEIDTPAQAGASQPSFPHEVERVVGIADVVAMVERLGQQVGAPVSAFQDSHAAAADDEFFGKDQPGHSAADDADVRVEIVSRGESVDVGDHRTAGGAPLPGVDRRRLFEGSRMVVAVGGRWSFVWAGVRMAAEKLGAGGLSGFIDVFATKHSENG